MNELTTTKHPGFMMNFMPAHSHWKKWLSRFVLPFFVLVLLYLVVVKQLPSFAQSTPSETNQEAIGIIDFLFSPRTLTVTAGTELIWTNSDSVPHTATANDGSFDSGTLGTNDTFSVTLSELGIYEYICTIHPSMVGSITVVEDEEETATSSIFLPLIDGALDPTPTPTATDNQTSTVPPTATDTPTATQEPAPLPEETPTNLLRWSDPATWGGTLPVAGANVTIPANQSILLDVSPPALNSLTIEGTLYFDEVDLSITAGWIMVLGTLRAGSESAPYGNQAIITLTGTGEDVMGMGDKVLGVMGDGILRLHGQSRQSWTRLNATANQGDAELILESAVNWTVGDKIVVSSTDFDYRQDEAFTITGIDGNLISLDAPLEYMHWGELMTYDGRTVDERAEVALLSRNIRIQGDAGSEPDGFGGHLMVMVRGKLYLDGVELYRMGQRGELARYPVHFHLMGDNSRGSFVKNTVIHRSFNRCLTIHGSNGVLVQSTVGYDAAGHCFFLEDAAEFDNVLEGNLGLGIYKPEVEDALLQSDRVYLGPAVYWITNPANTFRNNVAAGSQGTGFWIALPEHPTGPSYTTSIRPNRLPMQEFSGNVAHSNTVNGLHLDDGPTGDEAGTIGTTYYAVYTDPEDTDSDVLDVTLTNFTAYKNRNNGAWLRGRNHIIDGAIFADNAQGVTFASTESFARNSLFVGETDNMGQPEPYMIEQGQVGEDGRSLPFPWFKEVVIRGFEFYDGRIGVEDSHFVNFAPNSFREAAALSYLDYTNFAIHPTNFARGLTFGQGTKRVYLASRSNPEDPTEGTEDGYRSSVFLDVDGSVTGTANQYVVVDNPILRTEQCTHQSEWNVWLCPESEYVALTVRIDQPELNSVSLTRGGGTHTMFGAGRAPGTYFRSMALAATENTVTFDDHIPQQFKVLLTHSTGKWSLVKIPNYTQYPKVSRYSRELAPASNLTELGTASQSGWYYDVNATTLYLRLVAEGTYEALTVEQNGTPAPVTGSGTGLRGEYYANIDLAGTPIERVDGSINFQWPDAPMDNFPADNFTVRWTGQIEAPETSTYEIFVIMDDNVRLWVCGEQLLDFWQGYDPDPRGGTVTMTAGQRCDVQIDYREYTSWGYAQLWWQFGAYARQVVPQRQLYP
ncbi:MAG: G8 domain-containing protein [Chloroflexota bacterium]